MEHSDTSVSSDRHVGFSPTFLRNEAYASGVSWAAVIAGAFVAAALSLILLSLGTGLGLSSVSPWSNLGMSASTVGILAIIWLIIIQIVGSAMGGYLAGRLRTKWATIHTDEVYFRDTAHGFLVWAVGLVITAFFLASAALHGGWCGTRRADSAFDTWGCRNGNRRQRVGPNEYFIDSLFRSDQATLEERNDARVHAGSGAHFYACPPTKESPAADQAYLAQLVAANTGLSQTASETRVADVFGEIQ